MQSHGSRKIALSVSGAALGYFVDVFDLNVFNVISKQSLMAIGITDPALVASYDSSLLLWQLFGMLVGGFAWGMLGDKYGRRQLLFGSILLYSMANLANAFVTDIPMYIFLRFAAGVGLAGELGGAITLTSEIMDKSKRGYGTMVIVTMGALGAVAAATLSRSGFHIASFANWQSMYILGGLLGLMLLFLRWTTVESHVFHNQNNAAKKGALRLLFTSRKRFITYLACVMLGLPNWFCLGVLIKFAEDFARYNGVSGEPISVATCIMYMFIGLAVGDLLSGWLSQVFRSRKKIILWFFNFTLVFSVTFLFAHDLSTSGFYLLTFLLGVSTGYWVLFVTLASEQFGTNIRATATTSVPSLVRGLVIPITLGFKALQTPFGLTGSAFAVGAVCFGAAYLSLFSLAETFGRDLNFEEH